MNVLRMYFEAITYTLWLMEMSTWEGEGVRKPGWSTAGRCDITCGQECAEKSWQLELMMTTSSEKDHLLQTEMTQLISEDEEKVKYIPFNRVARIHQVIPMYLKKLRKHQIDTKKHQKCRILGVSVQNIKFVMYVLISSKWNFVWKSSRVP